MKVLLVNGSPRIDGCTNRALEEIKVELIKQEIDAEIVWLGTTVQSCVACGLCKSSGRCKFNDVVNVFGKKAIDADGFIFGSPVHYASASGLIVSFLDRLFYCYGNNLEYKPGAAIASARRAGTITTFDQLNKYFTINSMPVVSSQYWNGVHGTNASDVEKDLEGLQTMRTLAKNMAWLLKSIDAGKTLGIETPEKEKRERTNFIR